MCCNDYIQADHSFTSWHNKVFPDGLWWFHVQKISFHPFYVKMLQVMLNIKNILLIQAPPKQEFA